MRDEALTMSGQKRVTERELTPEEMIDAIRRRQLALAKGSAPANTTKVHKREPYAKLETITPDRAKTWLEKNTRNRFLSAQWVRSLAAEIIAGNWTIDGNPIRLSVDGELLDGQHRLHAIIAANKPVSSFIMYDLPAAAMHNIDRGRSRTLGDLFHINRGMKGGKQIAAICAQLATIEMGIRTAHGRLALSYPMAEKLFAQYQRHIEWAVPYLGNTIEPGIRNGSSPVVAAFVFMHSLPGAAPKVEAFAKRFKMGQISKVNDPAEALRRMCAQADKDSTARRGFCAKALKAIEADLKGQRLAILKMDDGIVPRVLAMREGG